MAGGIGYRAAHRKVEAELGPAWAETCRDCGGEAAEWSYRHDDPYEEIATEAEHVGMAYSLDPGHYDARCVSCHRAFDRKWRAMMAEALAQGASETSGYGYMPEAGWMLRKWWRDNRGLADDPVSDVRALIGAHVEAQDAGDLDTVALWVAATHLAAHGVGTALPRLAIVAPSFGAGKSTLLEMVARLSHRGEVITSSITDALIPRILQETGFCTLAIDEAEKVLRPENVGATAILNAGWQRGATARILQQSAGGRWVPSKIDTFAPIVMAGNGVKLAPDTRQRTLTVRLTRSEDTREVQWDNELKGVDVRLRERLDKWAALKARDPRVRNPALPEWLKARDRDRWALLISAARASSSQWARAADQLAAEDKAARDAEVEALGAPANVQLAYDLMKVWRDGEDWAGSSELADRLAVANPELWGQPSGKALTAQALTWKLREFYGVTPVRAGEPRRRGFGRTGVAKVWRTVGVESESGERVVLGTACR